MANWQLIEATDVECTLDNSGVHAVINRVVMGDGSVCVRVDLMCTDDGDPLVSFIGSANNVRKRLIAAIVRCEHPISHEHASYIGYELHRASTDVDYIQD